MAKGWAVDFYASKAWRSIRRQVLRRDLYTCTCGLRASEVHHITELTPQNMWQPISLDPANLISLCHDCHTKITKGKSDVAEGYIFDVDGQVIKV